MIEILLEILGAFLCTVGFAIFYRTKKKRLLLVGLSAAFGWTVCCVVEFYTDSIFLIYLMGAAAVTLYSEVMARLTKTPATVYLVPGLLPQFPGGSLYYTTYALVVGNHGDAKVHGMNTALAALGIAFGLVVVSVIMHYYNEFKLKKGQLKK